MASMLSNSVLVTSNLTGSNNCGMCMLQGSMCCDEMLHPVFCNEMRETQCREFREFRHKPCVCVCVVTDCDDVEEVRGGDLGLPHKNGCIHFLVDQLLALHIQEISSKKWTCHVSQNKR